jgi:divalent metal cation (Fe/Co/Zn/Cd) transporter
MFCWDEQAARAAAVLSGKRLEYFTIIWNLLEGIVSLIAGLLSGSISLVGFGVDSFIEVVSGSIVLWRMTVDRDVVRRERNEYLALKLVGFSLIGLAGCLVFQAIVRLSDQRAPQHSVPGILIAALSLIVMPVLSTAKRAVAADLKSSAMEADAKQADFCAYLSAILLLGLLLNAAFGYWWADPLAALIMVSIIGNEGINSSLGKECCEEN